MMMNPSIYYLTALPSILPFVYTFSLLCFLAGWHECSWTSMTWPLLYTLALPVMSYGMVLSIILDNHDISTVDSDLSKFLLTMLMVIDFGCVWLLRKLYLVYVEGPKPFQNVAFPMLDRVVMITGANAGIGKETASQLLEAGATVIFACRSEGKAKEAMEEIANKLEAKSRTHTGSKSPLITKPPSPIRERMMFLQMDLSDLNSIRKSVGSFMKMNMKLHVLVNNAGVMMGHQRITTDKNELTMQANHLGHFLLTILMLPKLRESAKESGDARIVTVSSSTHHLAEKLYVDDLNCEHRKYSLFGQYAQSKLANILFAEEVARRETLYAQEMKTPAVTSNSLHPGLVRTDVVRNMPFLLKAGNMAFGFILRTLQKAPVAGAYTSVYCAGSNDLRGSTGLYYSNSVVTVPSKATGDKEVAKLLWTKSEELVNLAASDEAS